jgi:hypothetical protein
MFPPHLGKVLLAAIQDQLTLASTGACGLEEGLEGGGAGPEVVLQIALCCGKAARLGVHLPTQATHQDCLGLQPVHIRCPLHRMEVHDMAVLHQGTQQGVPP